jgi:mannose-6-phosphate isomerase-like protein (cupin superfamily)
MSTPAKATYEPIRLGQLIISFIVSGADNDGRMCMFEFTVPRGAKVPGAHHHEKADEVVLGLEGTLTMTVAGERIDVGPGQSVRVPAGTAHHFVNLGSTTARALAVQTPGVIGPEYYREIAAVLKPGVPPDIEAMKGVMAKHGLTMVTDMALPT